MRLKCPLWGEQGPRFCIGTVYRAQSHPLLSSCVRKSHRTRWSSLSPLCPRCLCWNRGVSCARGASRHPRRAPCLYRCSEWAAVDESQFEFSVLPVFCPCLARLSLLVRAACAAGSGGSPAKWWIFHPSIWFVLSFHHLCPWFGNLEEKRAWRLHTLSPRVLIGNTRHSGDSNGKGSPCVIWARCQDPQHLFARSYYRSDCLQLTD